MSWNFLKIPFLESIIGDVDLVHGLSHVLPRSDKAKKVVTIHDLTCMIVPKTHPFSRRTFLPPAVRRSVRDADAIIAVSESTKRDIVDIFDVPADKITVTYNGVDHSTFTTDVLHDEIEKVKDKYSIRKKYIFYLGTIEPRKNVDILLQAFQEVRRRTDREFQLVLSGKIGWKVGNLMKAIRALAESGDLIYTGYISEDEAACLYNGAEVFVYPSRYEGFGIPAVEAMACGCPVIASDSSSLPEVVGDAGILVEPNNVGALSEAILKVLHDGELRRVLKEKGVQRAAQFTWARMAKATRDLYVSLIKG
jgi:glycosyltransferase involved in cell wall biosynthesis